MYVTRFFGVDGFLESELSPFQEVWNMADREVTENRGELVDQKHWRFDSFSTLQHHNVISINKLSTSFSGPRQGPLCRFSDTAVGTCYWTPVLILILNLLGNHYNP